MNAVGAGSKRESTSKLALRFFGRLAALALPFIGAGTLDWLRGWIFTSLVVLAVAANFVFMRWKNPALVRSRLEKHDDVKPFDRIFFAVAVPMGVAFLLSAGLAERLKWAPAPFEWLYLGVVLHFLGMVPVLAAIIHNPFLELSVRIQDDRGHVAVTSGPYRFIRHPMYAGFIFMFCGWPLVLGSFAPYIVIVLVSLAYIARAAFEDRTLREELPGYEEFCRKTRYRLLPGVW